MTARKIQQDGIADLLASKGLQVGVSLLVAGDDYESDDVQLLGVKACIEHPSFPLGVAIETGTLDDMELFARELVRRLERGEDWGKAVLKSADKVEIH